MHCWQNLHERRGQITVTLDNLPADKKAAQLPPGDFVHLTVQDDSFGLETQALKKLFDPFHSRKNSKKIGLELFIAREIIHGHHGEILASSEPGHGLTFHIFLPAADGR
jgi:signal transduction histidine kinase